MSDLAKIRELTETLGIRDEKLIDKGRVLEFLMENLLAGYWDWEIETGKEVLSDTWKGMFGYKPDELEDRVESWIKLIYPEDLVVAVKNYEKHVETKGKFPYDQEVRYYHKDGSTVHVRCFGKVYEWDGDKPKRMVGLHTFIKKI